MSDSEARLEVQVVYAIEQIVEEAADKRWPLDSETVEDAMNLVKRLQDSETDISDDVLNRTLDSLESIHHLVEDAPKRSVDHMNVQNMLDEFRKECLEAGIDL